MELELNNIQADEMVTDRDRISYGIGVIDRVKDGLVYVWYEEEGTMIHYREDQLNLLTKI